MSEVTSEGKKFDAGKSRLSLVDRYALEQIGHVLAYGERKYQTHNWRNGIEYSRLLDAALRHLYAYADGEDVDPESGLPHIAHAGCCIVFLLGMSRAHPEKDDRYKWPVQEPRLNPSIIPQRPLPRDLGTKAVRELLETSNLGG